MHDCTKVYGHPRKMVSAVPSHALCPDPIPNLASGKGPVWHPRTSVQNVTGGLSSYPTGPGTEWHPRPSWQIGLHFWSSKFKDGFYLGDEFKARCRATCNPVLTADHPNELVYLEQLWPAANVGGRRLAWTGLETLLPVLSAHWCNQELLNVKQNVTN